MKCGQIFRNVFNPSLKNSTLEKCSISVICLIIIWLTSYLSAYFLPLDAPILVASMGASAVILFVSPNSPMAQPWPFIAGHMVSGFVGTIISKHFSDQFTAIPLAIGIAVSLMFLLRCLHPPGAATALTPILSPVRTTDSFQFLWQPLAINIAIMLCLAIVINRLVLKHNYPVIFTPKLSKQDTDFPISSRGNLNISEIKHAIADSDLIVDIGVDELGLLLSRLQLTAFQKNIGVVNCGDIMTPIVHTAEYDTTVENAWNLFLDYKLTALPIIDRKYHLIGIVTQHDFLKHIDLKSYSKLERNWLSFLKPSVAPYTDKPESVGHIMTKRVISLSENTPINHLIPLMIDLGHRQIPIIDDKGLLQGIVDHNQMITYLFNHLCDHH